MALTDAEIGKLVAKEVRRIVSIPNYNIGVSDKEVQGVVTDCGNILRKEVSEDTLQRFEEILAVNVEKELSKRVEVDLVVDYRLDPESPLGRAATDAGVPYSNFPLKLWLKATRYSVEAQVGYNTKMNVLYSTKVYWNDRLRENRSDIHFLKETLDGKNPFWWGGPVTEK